MRREFFINIVILLGANLLVKPFYIFGIDRTVQNSVGPETYGIYFALFNFTFLFQIVNDFGIQQFNNRTIAQHPQLLARHFPGILLLKLVLALLYLGVVFLGGYLTGYVPQWSQLLFFIALNHVLISFTAFLRSNLSGLGKYRQDSLLSFLDKLLLIFICGFLLWSPLVERPFRIEWFVWAQNASWVLVGGVGLLLLRGHLPKFRFRWHLPTALVFLRHSYPFALVVLLMTLYTRVDGVMVERLLPDGEEQAGIYAAAYRLLDAANMIGFLFAGLLLPMFSNLLGKKEPVEPLIRFSFHLLWTAAAGLAAACWLFREEIMYLLYDEATPFYGEVLGILMLSFLAVSGIYIFSTLLTAHGSLRKMNQLFLISIALNVLLNYFFILEWKAAGAALATLITQSFVFLGKLYLSRTEVGLKFRLLESLRVIGFALSVFAAGYTVEKVLTLPWFWGFAAVLGLSGFLGIAFGLVRPKRQYFRTLFPPQP